MDADLDLLCTAVYCGWPFPQESRRQSYAGVGRETIRLSPRERSRYAVAADRASVRAAEWRTRAAEGQQTPETEPAQSCANQPTRLAGLHE